MLRDLLGAIGTQAVLKYLPRNKSERITDENIQSRTRATDTHAANETSSTESMNARRKMQNLVDKQWMLYRADLHPFAVNRAVLANMLTRKNITGANIANGIAALQLGATPQRIADEARLRELGISDADLGLKDRQLTYNDKLDPNSMYNRLRLAELNQVLANTGFTEGQTALLGYEAETTRQAQLTQLSTLMAQANELELALMDERSEDKKRAINTELKITKQRIQQIRENLPVNDTRSLFADPPEESKKTQLERMFTPRLGRNTVILTTPEEEKNQPATQTGRHYKF